MRHSYWLAVGFVGLVGCGSAPGGALDESDVGDVASEDSALLDECAGLNDYTAAIASRTIDCVGTIGPNQFVLDANGLLRRSERFSQCTLDKEALPEIDALLSLQHRREGAPLATRCIAGRWKTWHDAFVRSGITSCPAWEKTGVINPVNEENVKKVVATLPKLPDEGGQARPIIPHENYRFTVSYGKVTVPERCGTPAGCAKACAGGFAGFVLAAKGDQAIGDPIYWLVSKVYSSTNPFSAPYYHAMSYSGDLPGELYGHYNRVGEECSRYMSSDGTHHPSHLIEDCLIAGDRSTCLSRCQNPYDPGEL